MGRVENMGMLGSNKLDTADVTVARVLSNHDGLGVAEIGTACLVLWRAPVATERFERQRAALEALVRRHPTRAGFVCGRDAGHASCCVTKPTGLRQLARGSSST
jgi:hypothetical protein